MHTGLPEPTSLSDCSTARLFGFVQGAGTVLYRELCTKVIKADRSNCAEENGIMLHEDNDMYSTTAYDVVMLLNRYCDTV